MNEFIVVENEGGVFHSTLGQAINAGISRARHDLLAIVKEDVVLQPGWQAMFEASLSELEQADPDWSVVGVMGWGEDEQPIGHCSAPGAYCCTFGVEPYAQAARLDDQFVVLRRSRDLRPDPKLPSVHNIGRDLTLSASRRGLASYTVNAPTIDRYADAAGRPILGLEDANRSIASTYLTFVHDIECSDEYLNHKWHKPNDRFFGVMEKSDLTCEQIVQLDSPIVLLGRGGSGTRLMQLMADDVGLFTGNLHNRSGDCMEMVGCIYRTVFRKYRCPDEWHKSLVTQDLRSAAVEMLRKASWPTGWAFKLPESHLILPEIQAAFPKARFVFLHRDPLATALRRSHITARLDNRIGQAALPPAYDFAGLPRAQILIDCSAIRMARTSVHQIALAMKLKAGTEQSRWHDVKLEDLVVHPRDALSRFGDWCGRRPESNLTGAAVDPERASQATHEFSRETISTVEEIVSDTRKMLGYL